MTKKKTLTHVGVVQSAYIIFSTPTPLPQAWENHSDDYFIHLIAGHIHVSGLSRGERREVGGRFYIILYLPLLRGRVFTFI